VIYLLTNEPRDGKVGGMKRNSSERNGMTRIEIRQEGHKYATNAYFNQNMEAMMPWRGYEPGDKLKISSMIVLPHGDSPKAAAEVVFTAMNLDDRPNGAYERSLSVGDVVCLIDVQGVEHWLAVESVGYREIDKPQEDQIQGEPS
jgi:hypothetical protein